MKLLKICVATAALLFSTAALSQTLNYRIQTGLGTSFAPQGTGQSIQVRVDMMYDSQGVGTVPNFEGMIATINYTASAGLMAGDPALHNQRFAVAGHPGIGSPGTAVAQVNATMFPANIVNTATTGATGPLPLDVTPTGGTDLAGLNFVNVGAPSVSGQFIIAASTFDPNIFTLSDGVWHGFAVLDFPIAVSQIGTIDLNFDNTASANNQLVIEAGAGGGDVFAGTTDGTITVFAPPVCSGATVVDNNGGTPGALNYEDITAGGMGGNITPNLPSAGLDRFQISGTDGYVGMNVLATGASTVLGLTTAVDGSPSDTVDSVTYTITPEVEFPAMSGSFVSGTPCTVVVTWAPATCTAVFDAAPVVGNPTNLDVVITNGRFVTADYGTVTLPDLSTVALAAPAVAANVLTFDNVVAIAAASALDVGTYSVAGNGPGTSVANCSAVLTLDPPVNQTDCATLAPAVIGLPLSLTLAGNIGTVNFDVIYNGITDAGVPAGAFSTTGNCVATATDITTRANGFDMAGNPIFDETTCPLDFVPPVCDTIVQNPDTTMMPVDPGTVVTITVTTTGAIDVEAYLGLVSLGVLTPDVDPNTNNIVNWTLAYTAGAPVTLDFVVANPDGETVNCSTAIAVNCSAVITSITGSFPSALITIEGVGSPGGLSYDLYASPDCSVNPPGNIPAGATFLGSITLVDPIGGGFVSNSGTFTVPADQCIYVTCDASPAVLDRFGTTTVPTLGEWGLALFAVLLMAAGVFFMRRKRIA